MTAIQYWRVSDGKEKLDKEIILGAIFGIIAIIAIICEMSLGGFSKEAIPEE